MLIEVLAPDIAAKIAAGEVVERPASVVKELVENSLDAGATRIAVEVRGGGTGLIRVTDDGCGIPPDQVELAFQRHATSKLAGAADLDRISTMGFRGEALPSIAAVSRVSLVTRPSDQPAGRRVDLRWGEPTGGGAAGGPSGTSISVEGLFENLPARLKFLRSPSSEAGRIGDIVSRYALAFPEVALALTVDGRRVIDSPGRGGLAEGLVAVYGAEIAATLLEVDWSDSEGLRTMSGFVSPPSFNRANRSYITFLVNRRWVQSTLLSVALAECYHGLLPERRHPLAVLNLTCPLEEVDVNVHPAKREVRFRQENQAFSAVQRSVRAALLAHSPVPQISIPLRPSAGDRLPVPGAGRAAARPDGPWSSQGSPEGIVGGAGPPTLAQAAPNLRILGQAQATYVVAEGPGGLYLIDQHAAHERVLFERVTAAAAGRQEESQALLEPVPAVLSPEQEELLRSNLEVLTRFGFVLEPFGERTWLVRAVPSVAGGGSPERALTNVLDLLGHPGPMRGGEDALAASIACHSAIRAGMSLGEVEMEELVRQLQTCENPHTCPHGRPTMVHLSSRHLEREFGRR